MRKRTRFVWDRAALSGSEWTTGRRDAAVAQLERLFEGLGADARGTGTCLDLGCGSGRMTVELAERWPHVVATDVSPAMLAQAREHVTAKNVTFLETSDRHLDGVGDESADTVVCFGVFQHLPTRSALAGLLAEIRRVLRPDGEAFVQLPVLRPGLRSRLWRTARAVHIRVTAYRPRPDFNRTPEWHGTRITRRELQRAVAHAGLEIEAELADHDPTMYSRYPHADDVRLRLRRLRRGS